MNFSRHARARVPMILKLQRWKSRPITICTPHAVTSTSSLKLILWKDHAVERSLTTIITGILGDRRVCDIGFVCRTFTPSRSCLCCGPGLGQPPASKASSWRRRASSTRRSLIKRVSFTVKCGLVVKKKLSFMSLEVWSCDILHVTADAVKSIAEAQPAIYCPELSRSDQAEKTLSASE